MCNAFYIGYFPSHIAVYLCLILISSPKFVPFNVKYNNLQSRNAYKYSAYFFTIKPTRCTNFTNLFCHETTCFGQFVCPSSGVYSLYTQKWYMSYRFVDSFRGGPICMTYTIAECTVHKLLMMDRRTVRNM
jgi:hypothetical protein